MESDYIKDELKKATDKSLSVAGKTSTVIQEHAQTIAGYAADEVEEYWRKISRRSLKRLWLADAQLALVELASLIHQDSPKNAFRLFDAIISKGAGASSTAGLLGLISTFGTASTGTAISTLTGAAATSAKFYWLGSIVGGGVAAGGGIAIVGAVGTGLLTNRLWKGKLRLDDELIYEEEKIVNTAKFLSPILKDDALLKSSLENDEINELRTFWDEFVANVVDYERKTRGRLLAPKHRFRLRKCIKELKRLQETFNEINAHIK